MSAEFGRTLERFGLRRSAGDFAGAVGGEVGDGEDRLAGPLLRAEAAASAADADDLFDAGGLASLAGGGDRR
ncbi:hypothetical protein [Actinacidiphila oryziradicis]|uniref:Uncharacterized protein n=1 Tax=Actinacidiphila oryziradicis TaxID=2571141 RepID=A0A4U0RME3_9ACTN|nr:hypothetical protein [Actinacidiphila oryziradicis]TJZ96262.1 hypothetical protein FCI23_51220 [Actinacidiphila oryziradicis]